MLELTEITVSNFKSLKSINLKISGFCALVGANSSGKTNILESLKFLKKIFSYSEPYLPYLDWWTFSNVVWKGNEKLPITFTLSFKKKVFKKLYSLKYEITLTGVGGKFDIPHEKISIDDVISLERNGEFYELKHDEKYVESKYDYFLQNIKKTWKKEQYSKYTKEKLINQKFKLPVGRIRPGLSSFSYSASYDRNQDFTIVSINLENSNVLIISPISERIIRTSNGKTRTEWSSLFPSILFEIGNFIQNITIIHSINQGKLREPTLVKGSTFLDEDAGNLINILHAKFMKELGFPKRISAGLFALFPNMTLKLELTNDGRVFLKVIENSFELNPPCISDGFFKVLTLLVAIESKPSIIAIDEIENSLHARALEYIIDELKNAGTNVIITTHSAIVVDIVQPDDLAIVDRDEKGTHLRYIKNPLKIRNKLSELGITQSDMWLYGELE
jgi:predicted ATPase